MVEKEFPQVKLIRNEKNLGFAGGNNLGLRNAKGDVILLLNPDTIVHPGALLGMLDFQKKHPDAIQTCRLLNGNGTIQHNARTIDYFGLFNAVLWEWGLARICPLINKRLRRINGHNFSDDRIYEVGYISGTCIMATCRTFQKVGELDDRFFMFSEDMDWCLRARRKGFRIYLNPYNTITHFWGQSTMEDPAKFRVEFYRNRAELYRKHFGLVHAGIFRIIVGAGYLKTLFLNIVKLITALNNSSRKSLLNKFKHDLLILKWAVGVQGRSIPKE